MGLSAALANAGRSLEVFTAGITVAGQNIANANTPGYVRERLVLASNPSYQVGGLLFGTGVQAVGIKQQIDLYLEGRLYNASSDAAAVSARRSIFQQLEGELRELGKNDLSTAINEFLATIDEVANQPNSTALRQVAIQQGEQLAADISSLRSRVDELRKAQSGKVESLVDEANRLIETIERLNPQIAKQEAAGLLRSDAGGLRSERYAALQRLSEIIPITFRENESGAVDVYSGSDFLVLTGTSQRLETVAAGDRGVAVQNVRFSVTKSPLTGSGGELNGVIDGRDDILGGFVDQLNTFTSQFIDEFNKIHASGEGLSGFTSVTATNGVNDINAALSGAGLAFTPGHGSFQVKVTNSLTGITETTTINIDLDGIDPGNDTSLDGLRASLAAVDNLSASISTDRRLVITADSGYEIRFASDTSGVLASLGINTFFTGSDSSSIGVNAVVRNDRNFFAAGRGAGPGDGSNAILLADFANKTLGGLGGKSLIDFYESTVASIAQSAASENTLHQGLSAFRDSLTNQREQFSGVSLDEEAIRVLEFQKAYQASARLISVIDELMTTLLNI